MRRRNFITLLGGTIAIWPRGGLAQEAGKVWRMGFIAQGYERFYDALFEGLRELGYAPLVRASSSPCQRFLDKPRGGQRAGIVAVSRDDLHAHR